MRAFSPFALRAVFISTPNGLRSASREATLIRGARSVRRLVPATRRSEVTNRRCAMRSALSGALVLAALGFVASAADARNLVVYNEGATAARCVETQPAEVPARAIDVPPGSRVAMPAGAAGIDEVLCGALRLGHLDVRSDANGANDRIVVLNGRQLRTLRVALFPYLPSSPAGDLGPLTRALEERFQRRAPDVALQLVMSSDVDPYDYDSFATTFGANGYDAVEIDTSVLSTLSARITSFRSRRRRTHRSRSPRRPSLRLTDGSGQCRRGYAAISCSAGIPGSRASIPSRRSWRIGTR